MLSLPGCLSRAVGHLEGGGVGGEGKALFRRKRITPGAAPHYHQHPLGRRRRRFPSVPWCAPPLPGAVGWQMSVPALKGQRGGRTPRNEREPSFKPSCGLSADSWVFLTVSRVPESYIFRIRDNLVLVNTLEKPLRIEWKQNQRSR
uniref:Bladder cancer-associated protein isoform X1 n=1 Tax=Phascolarctos cinereus TaxID=38626 RepID=A0A6P5KLE9_PHACI|nr:bladder cancer-associated protein isoform X1 [Phascolarctos cinereus]